jgi:cardiolipin synthase
MMRDRTGGDALAARLPSWLPNVFTVVRVALIPLFVLLAARCQSAAHSGFPTASLRASALVVLLFLGASDLVDGYLARRHGLGSQLGAVLDALADKLAQVTLVLFFALSRGPAFAVIPFWFVFVVFGRDLIMAAGYATVRLRKGRVFVRHKLHGKLASSLIFVLLVALTAGASQGFMRIGFWLATFLVVMSTLDYMRDGWIQFRATE